MLNIRIVFTIDDTGWIPRSGGREGAPSQFLAKCTENLALVPQYVGRIQSILCKLPSNLSRKKFCKFLASFPIPAIYVARPRSASLTMGLAHNLTLLLSTHHCQSQCHLHNFLMPWKLATWTATFWVRNWCMAIRCMMHCISRVDPQSAICYLPGVILDLINMELAFKVRIDIELREYKPVKANIKIEGIPMKRHWKVRRCNILVTILYELYVYITFVLYHA